jgi:ABC-type antimicrobial peptide transport system permease subunit
MKALGARTRILYSTALVEALLLSICGFAVGWLMAASLAAIFDHWRPVIDARLPHQLVLRTLAIVVVVNLLATLPPILHVRRLDPQEVFKA